MNNRWVEMARRGAEKRRAERSQRRYAAFIAYAQKHPESELAKLLRGEYEPS